ncbi:MAG: cell division protein FtsA [Candidatus Yanofskybacteria bacterium RIFCSPLOWO2_01_FULL_49_25]|uniref:Cell division protein FtsA n=1 Tax=Candidatus Yanofskybacteria bacterium RIFCSPLOWO2_01_FULL_49_25 TaxID=1802701 RepID=A0A1F8GTD2_9BACT|nr:MAG: cell division protein FtsA [Candidatus Yanofskybacteria bacterium RIFCSPLOWO2_01_FULL_49_25]
MKSSVICGIDVGNATIKTVIAEIGQDVLRPSIIGVGVAPSNGLRRGTVVDMEEAMQSVGASIANAEAMAGVKVKQAYASVSGTHIRTQTSRGVIAVARADNEISQSDMTRLIEAASTVSLPLNYEIIHVVPRAFIIDGQEHVKNPVGMKGVRVEVEVLLIEGLSPYMRNLAKCINASGVEVSEFVYAPLAASKAVLDKHQREYGVALVDLGGGVSSLALFHEGDLVHTAIMPIGARHITNDLAIAFRTSLDVAEEIKHEYGFVGSAEATSKKEQVDLSSMLGEDGSVVPRKQIGKIVDARIHELFDLITQEFKKPAANLMFPAGIVLAGGGANLAGLPAFAKNRIGLAVRIAGVSGLDGFTDQISDPSFAVAVGLILWGADQLQSGGERGGSTFMSGSGVKRAVKWLKNFMP